MSFFQLARVKDNFVVIGHCWTLIGLLTNEKEIVIFGNNLTTNEGASLYIPYLFLIDKESLTILNIYHNSSNAKLYPREDLIQLSKERNKELFMIGNYLIWSATIEEDK